MGPPTDSPVQNSFDSINTILFDSLPAGIGMLTTLNSQPYYTSPPCSANGAPAAVITDIDIRISKFSNFCLSTNDSIDVPYGQHSLMGEARHEFGHAVGLQHVLNSADVMYYTDPGGGSRPAQINHDDQNGGIYQLDKDSTYLRAGCYSPQLYPDSCPSLTIINGVINMDNNPFKVAVYPNPFSDKIIIEAEVSIEGDMKATIFDLLGEMVAFSDFGMKSGSVQETMPVSGLNSGVYIIQVTVGFRKTQIKMIKINN